LKKLEEEKKAEMEEDQRWRGKGKGRAVDDMLEAGPPQSCKRKARDAAEGLSSKKLKVSVFLMCGGY